MASRSDLVVLDLAKASSVFAAYRHQPAFFPLIGAVLEGTQDGGAYANDAKHPRQVYVEHAFGFAQIFGERVPDFEASLKRYLMHDRTFAVAKVRLYTPQLPSFLLDARHSGLRSERQRFVAPPPGQGEALVPSGLQAVGIDSGNFEQMEAAFGVASRFWRTPADFINGARATMVLLDRKPAALCYAAAVSDRRAEIDVLTLPPSRRRGAGRLAVQCFIDRCRTEAIEPLWDCFTNNSGSMQLCRAVGFLPAGAPYPFFTIGK